MFAGVVIPEVTTDLIKRTWTWYDQALIREPKLNAGTIVLIEIMQKVIIPQSPRLRLIADTASRRRFIRLSRVQTRVGLMLMADMCSS
jgi:hypothetical protein